MRKINSFIIVACFCAALSMTAALKCFRCGKYTPDGAGSIIPCYDYNHTDLKECHNGDRYCLKYLNKGIIVRDCVQECKSGIQELSEFFCCQEDGCNGCRNVKLEWTLWILIALIILTQCVT